MATARTACQARTCLVPLWSHAGVLPPLFERNGGRTILEKYLARCGHNRDTRVTAQVGPAVRDALTIQRTCKMSEWPASEVGPRSDKLDHRREYEQTICCAVAACPMPIDSTQLAQLIDRHGGVLRVWVGRRCLASDDVVQEAFCRLSTQEPVPDNPVAWLYRVSRNLAEKQRKSDERRRRREAVRAQADTMPHPNSDPAEISEVMEAVQQLDSELKDVLVARLWGQMSLEEVAKICGISTATAFRRYEAALVTLRSKLGAQRERHT